MGKRVTIVFEETEMTPEGGGFNVYLEGIAQERKNLPEDQLSAAEFWGMRMFQIVGQLLAQAGAARTVQKKGS